MGVIVIIKEKVIERRLSKRISQQLHLTIRSHSSSREIQNATIENISIGGMQFSVPADNTKLRIHETCSLIFDLPHLGKSYILGEIRYCRDFIVPNQQPVIHYGVKFIKLSMKTWHHIKRCCQSETSLPGKFASKEPEVASQTSSVEETLTTKTLELINAQIRLENDLELFGKVVDINYGGIKLQFAKPIPLHCVLVIRISFMDHSVTANGKCNWCNDVPVDGNLFLANISFTEIQHQEFDNLQFLMMKLASHMADLISKTHFQS